MRSEAFTEALTSQLKQGISAAVARCKELECQLQHEQEARAALEMQLTGSLGGAEEIGYSAEVDLPESNDKAGNDLFSDHDDSFDEEEEEEEDL